MRREVTSKHLRGTTELSLLAPIRPGFVQVTDVMSYATRLRTLLGAVFELRRVLIERDLRDAGGALEALQTIHITHWAVLEPQQQLLFTVTFDRSWEEYIHVIVDKGGPLLDILFSHCLDYENHTCRHGYERFAEWVRRHQLPFDFAYSAAPDLTVDDLRYLRQLSKTPVRAPDVARLSIGTPEADGLARAYAVLAAKHPDWSREQIREVHARQEAEIAAQALDALRDLRPSFPDVISARRTRALELPELTDQKIFDNAVLALVSKTGLTELWREPPPDLQPFLQALAQSRDVAEQERRKRRDAPDVASPSPEDVQGNVVDSYTGMTHGCAVLLQCRDARALRGLIDHLLPRVTSQAKPEPVAINIAITYTGLRRLRLRDSILQQFPKEFREGMEQRAGLMGDVGPNSHPAFWARPRVHESELPLSTVDAVVSLQAAPRDFDPDREVFAWGPDHPLQGEYQKLALDTLPGVSVLHVQPLRRYFEPAPASQCEAEDQAQVVREHFGFIDAGSQPIPTFNGEPWPPLAARAARTACKEDHVPLGEFLLGYRDTRGEIAQCAQEFPVLFRNGTFAAMRKLEQNVPAFDEFARENAQALRGEPQPADIKGWVVGRSLEEGGPIVDARVRDNSFDYRNDPEGLRCPLHAHIRRTHPRPIDENGQRAPVARILRRGFSYGPRYCDAPHERERGLLFIACNASLASQFEVIQRWINGGNVTGLLSSANDMFVGAPESGGVRWVRAGEEYVALRGPSQPLVTLRWGMYLFVPSLSALRWLGQLPPDATTTSGDSVAAGREILSGLKKIEALQGTAAARDAWKRVLEEPPRRELAACVWAAVRAEGGSLSTPYGRLIGDEKGVRGALSDDGGHYSVLEYRRRMTESLGEMHLGLDVKTSHYREVAAAPNQFIAAITRGDAEREAYLLATDMLQNIPARPDGRRRFKLRQFTALVVGEIAQARFGAPIGQDPRHSSARAVKIGQLLEHFVNTSRYIFGPSPEPNLRVTAQASGHEIRRAYASPEVLAHPMANFLREQGGAYYGDDQNIRQAQIGATSGFAAATIGSFIGAWDVWLESGEFWRLSQAVQTCASGDELVRGLFEAMMHAPVPGNVHRRDISRLGDAPREPAEHERIVVGLGSACTELGSGAGWPWLFGGTREAGGQPHACPGAEMALGVMLGMARAILEQKNLKRDRRLVVSFEVGEPSG